MQVKHRMTGALAGQGIRRHRRTCVLVIALSAAFGLSSAFHLFWSAGAQAQDRLDLMNGSSGQLKIADPPITPPPNPCSDKPPSSGTCPSCVNDVPGASPYEKSLPVPTLARGFDYVVQLVNESTVTILAAANAANQGGKSPIAVEPREGTWVMKPKPAGDTYNGDNGNILTIDIPKNWEGTECPQTNRTCGAVGPRFYPRTGCKYDIKHNLAQCETGGCGDAYDCGKQALRNLASSGKAPVSIVEWTFNSQGGQGYAYPDISLVDGVSITIDVQALGKHCESKPGVASEPNWLSMNQPLAKHGIDLRANCIPNFQLTRGQVGQIIEGTGNPNDVVACFTNCGKYEYPTTPRPDCDPSDPVCKYWRDFCCYTPPGDPAHVYGGTCTSNQTCGQSGGCWVKGSIDKTGVCSCRAFIKNDTCPANVCTHPNPPNISAQPEFGHCSDVTTDDNACIGDDTVHNVFPGGYTWPNDPQTYVSDARAYRIIFAPGGLPDNLSITDSGAVPACSSLPADYGDSSQYGGSGSGTKPCDITVNKNGAKFAGAIYKPDNDHTWACSIANGGPVTTGAILCSW